MIINLVRRMASIAVLFCIFADSPARAQQPSLPSAASLIAPQVTNLENEIAQLAQKRDSTPEATQPWLDFQIDARIFARWLLTQSAGRTDGTDSQIAAYLHAVAMLAVVPVVDDFGSRQSAAPDALQSVGTSRLHQLTFELKEAKDSAALDTACAHVAEDIVIATTTLRPGEHLPALVPMRPALSPSSQPDQSATDQNGPKSIEELAELARQASVSPALRRQLIALATLAQQQPKSDSDQAESIRQELQSALDLAAGLQANTAVTPDERERIEAQMCDGLALFGDPRMRDAGRARLAALDAYRELLDRVKQMRVPPELHDSLSPALALAHEHPDQAEKLLSPLEQFVALYARHQARPQQPVEFADLRSDDPLRRAYDELSTQFAKAQTDFLAEAARIGKPDSPSEYSRPAADTLTAIIARMDRFQDLLDVLVSMPKTIQTLTPYKPSQGLTLQRRLNVTLVPVIAPAPSPARDAADQQLIALHKLAQTADQLANRPFAGIPPAIAQNYAGGQLGNLAIKWKSMVAEMTGAFCTDQPIDHGKIERLRVVNVLLDALEPPAAMEAAFAKPEGLSKWADWALTPEQVHALMAPYQQAMSQAFAGFISDNPDALATFSKLQPRYEPVMSLITRTGGFADACAQLPDGTLGLLSRLGTPYADAPFADQRFVSFVAARAASGGGDSAVNNAAAAVISQRLARR